MPILQNQGISAKQVDNQSVEVYLTETEIPELIRLLVENQVNIYAVERSKESLEEQFLKLTNEEQGGKAYA
jgi:ABC-2 type transport system ATP-binding protein